MTAAVGGDGYFIVPCDRSPRNAVLDEFWGFSHFPNHAEVEALATITGSSEDEILEWCKCPSCSCLRVITFFSGYLYLCLYSLISQKETDTQTHPAEKYGLTS
jgi:hypothetical protein